jgi:thiosulfate dehydrogenase
MRSLLAFAFGSVALAGLAILVWPSARLRADTIAHRLPAPLHGGVVVELCDGETATEVADAAPGVALGHDRAQAVADDLMQRWQARHPEARWEMARADGRPSGEAPVPAPAQTQGGVYEAGTPRDRLVWTLETKKFVDEGNAIFHNADRLGGTVGISCDMCHPNAANTHPETYPKYQVQLQRVALLRDMINWCIENPVKGKPLPDDDPRLRAIEAYILAQRKGVALEYGKH